MTGVVITGCPRLEADVLAGFAGMGVATVYEAQGRTGLLAPYMRPIYSGASILGAAVTVSAAPGDNWMLHVAVEQCARGDVLVVAPTAACDIGYLGDLLATSLAARGVAGVIIDGGVRDVGALTQMRFPVWSRAICAHGPLRRTVGSVNVPILCAGQRVEPGDLVLADDDGVVVIPFAAAGEVARKTAERAAREERVRLRLAAGELGLDIYDMRQQLSDQGLVYRPWDERG